MLNILEAASSGRKLDPAAHYPQRFSLPRLGYAEMTNRLKSCESPAEPRIRTKIDPGACGRLCRGASGSFAFGSMSCAFIGLHWSAAG